MKPAERAKRRERLKNILGRLTAREAFTSREIQIACQEKSPAFVTRVLKQLTEEGILHCDESDKPSRFRWQSSPHAFPLDRWVEQQIVGTQITASPVQDRPRERLMQYGVERLRTAELLAILIRTGRQGESALDAGERISNRFAAQLEQLRALSFDELKAVSQAVSTAAYCQIMAGIELGRRVAEALAERPAAPRRIDSTAAAIEYCQRKYARLASDRQQEEFHVITLDTKLFPIGGHQVTVGTLDASLVHPREVFRAAIRDAASAVILLHNHPSGDPTPSREDIQVTERMKQAADIIGIRVLDHIVVASQGSVSLSEWQSR